MSDKPGTSISDQRFRILLRRNKVAAMNGRELYQRKATDCVQAAGKMRDPVQRAAMLEIAHCYMILAKLADVAARHERDTAQIPIRRLQS
jgi:hypothetical protein